MTETCRINYGGLVRCCLLSLDDAMAKREKEGKPLTVEGDVIPCEYCESSVICKGGVWQWNREVSVPARDAETSPIG